MIEEKPIPTEEIPNHTPTNDKKDELPKPTNNGNNEYSSKLTLFWLCRIAQQDA